MKNIKFAITFTCVFVVCLIGVFDNKSIANADTATSPPVALTTLLVGVWKASYYTQVQHSGTVTFKTDGSYQYTDSVNPIHDESGTWSVSKDNVINMNGVFFNLNKSTSFYVFKSSPTRIDAVGLAPLILEK